MAARANTGSLVKEKFSTGVAVNSEARPASGGLHNRYRFIADVVAWTTIEASGPVHLAVVVRLLLANTVLS